MRYYKYIPFCVLQLTIKAQHVVSRALDQFGARDVGKHAKEKWFESKTLTFMSSVSPAPVRNGNLVHNSIAHELLLHKQPL